MNKSAAKLSRESPYRTAAVVAGLLACLLWSYWPTVVDLCTFWAGNDDYSAGALVPLAAVFLVWRNREKCQSSALHPSWWGLVAILVAQACRYLAVYLNYGSAERYSIVLSTAGVVLLVGGRATIWRPRWIIAVVVVFVTVTPAGYERS